MRMAAFLAGLEGIHGRDAVLSGLLIVLESATVHQWCAFWDEFFGAAAPGGRDG
jgi:hypothetical protein